MALSFTPFSASLPGPRMPARTAGQEGFFGMGGRSGTAVARLGEGFARRAHQRTLAVVGKD
ncbi:hypothetical protein FRACA_440021 [Frankia canadensis]|uniref:Uncharacterized protein n=1 Tax=Frankia canadensis TaxID=1836972 RepID=A0A2I2KXD8_9ACTN|nr:hypothetical protein FRACA_440021 [Frankia canadensis]SOU57614.1 hypothetical protein FRACA_440021 [Frankia canadensis]